MMTVLACVQGSCFTSLAPFNQSICLCSFPPGFPPWLSQVDTRVAWDRDRYLEDPGTNTEKAQNKQHFLQIHPRNTGWKRSGIKAEHKSISILGYLLSALEKGSGLKR